MNFLASLQYGKLDSIAYDSIFLEKPMSHLVKFNYKNILKAPSSNSDQSTLKELKIVSDASINRTSEDMKLIKTVDQNLDYLFIKLLQRYGLKYPQAYINEFYKIVFPILLNTKGFWNRPRPHQLAEFYGIPIRSIITNTTYTPSYPSGHTVYSSLVAHILNDKYPQIDRKELDRVVSDTARARIMQGVHFPSDNKASLIFTQYVYSRLYKEMNK